MPLTNEIADYLDSNTTLTVATTLFEGLLPPEPDEAVGIFEYPGSAPQDTLGRDLPAWENPRIQVKVRGETYAGARARMDEVWRLLHKVKNQTLGSTFYLRIAAIDHPQLLERDDQARRIIFVANFQVQRVPV